MLGQSCLFQKEILAEVAAESKLASSTFLSGSDSFPDNQVWSQE
jgi:hypothetical protein